MVTLKSLCLIFAVLFLFSATTAARPRNPQQRDIYLGLSLFMFDGSVRAVQNDFGAPDTLCLGAEVLCDYSTEQLQVTITHEIFHLYHFNFLFAETSLAQLRTGHIPLM